MIVGENLPITETLTAIAMMPATSIPLQLEAVTVFPGGVLALACVVNHLLAREQSRVHNAAKPFVVDEWPFFLPGRWTPHITLSTGSDANQLGYALSIVLPHLPIHGSFDHGGIEDGTSGENWPIAQITSDEPYV